MEEEKKNNGLVAVVVILSLLVLGLGGYLAYDKILSKNENIPSDTPTNQEIINDKPEVPQVAALSGEEILGKAIGEWGMCDDNHGCYGINVAKNQELKYIYRPYQMWSDGFYGGTVENIEKTDNNTIKITVHYDEVHNIAVDIDEHTNEYVINIDKIDQDILIADSVEYKKIIGDRETFFTELNK